MGKGAMVSLPSSVELGRAKFSSSPADERSKQIISGLLYSTVRMMYDLKES